MPAFTQEELDELAYVEPTETRDETRQSTVETRAEVGDEGVMEDSDGVQMKHELEADIQQVPSRNEHEDRMEEDTNEEFIEAQEHMNPQETMDQGIEALTHNDDVPMEDVADNEDAEETEGMTEDDTVQLKTSIKSDPNPDHDPEVSVVDGEASGSDAESQSESEDQKEAESDEVEEEEEEDDDEESEASGTTDGSESESASEAESDSESREDEEDGDDENVADETSVPAVCPLCHKSVEDDDEELLECSKCEVRVHSECAQDNEWIKDGADTDSWQCLNCVRADNSESPKETSKRNRNSAPRLVRDLLPVSRGVQRPNSHSIFAQPLISESEDGGRALRKRKSPTAEPPVSEKRRRKATPKALLASLPELSKTESMAHATRRASQKSMPTARILQYRPYEKAPPHKFILAFRLEQSKIEKILEKPPRPGRRRDRRKPPKIPPPPIFHPPVPKFPALPTNHLIFPSMWSDRENEANAKPYGGILTDAEADTSRSLPQLKDRELFERAREEAEEERRKTSAAAEAEINGENANTTKPNRTVSGPPSKIKCIQFGKHVIDTFYAAPYPEEYSHESRLFICEFCLKYLPSEFVAYRHKLKCPAKHPPGDEIYRDGTISVWEVDGRKKTEYCQCLCLMAKMFLGSKTLYYDVEPFLFYILTEYDEFGYHFVGYFSKEKRPASQNNVSCILVMPIHQRKGYATFLIDFSYLLTRIEGKDGSPEKPLSDMGLTAYRSYWDLTISRQLLDIGMKPFSVKDLMQRTGMTADDVVHSLERLYAFVKDPVTKTYAIRYDQKLYQNIVIEFESKKHRELRPEKLIWTPYIMGRSDQAHLDTQPVQTMAPREGDEVIIEDNQDVLEKSTDEEPGNEQEISPKTAQDPHTRSPSQPQAKDPRLVNGVGHVAPGPPSAQLLTGPVMNTEEPVTNGVTTGNIPKDSADSAEQLSGYALAHRTLNIPANRYQIDPPIPPSMLRNRTHKKRNTGFGRRTTNGDRTQTPTTMAPVRSSPRHAASANGSVNGSMDNGSPEKSSTPMRRSNRKSGLSNMEVAGLDGSMDPDEEDIGDEIEAKVESGSESESSSAEESESGEAEDDDEDAEIPEDEEEDEEDDDGDADDDPDALDVVNESEEDESDED